MREFQEADLSQLFRPQGNSRKGENGLVTIIGGSSLFHGSPLLALQAASRVVDMTLFSSPYEPLEKVVDEIKGNLASFIWIPWEKVEEYLEKSDAILIGPGLMRYRSREMRNGKKGKILDGAGRETKVITEKLLSQFDHKQWVIDAGSLQVMEAKFIPQKAILTPNRKEFELLFEIPLTEENVEEMAKKYDCVLVDKGVETRVVSSTEMALVKGGNAGMTKGGTGDALAGLTVALAAKNSPFLAACAASWINKRAGDELYKRVGFAYNADDLAKEVQKVLGQYFR